MVVVAANPYFVKQTNVSLGNKSVFHHATNVFFFYFLSVFGVDNKFVFSQSAIIFILFYLFTFGRKSVSLGSRHLFFLFHLLLVVGRENIFHYAANEFWGQSAYISLRKKHVFIFRGKNQYFLLINNLTFYLSVNTLSVGINLCILLCGQQCFSGQ